MFSQPSVDMAVTIHDSMTGMSWRASMDGLAACHVRISTYACRRQLEPQMVEVNSVLATSLAGGD
jgi:hypothetical protein